MTTYSAESTRAVWEQASREIERVFRTERQRALATLIRLLGGDFDLAEDGLQEAFAEAVSAWPKSGVPGNPRAWLVSTARHKGLDRLRRQSRFEEKRQILSWTAPRFEPPDLSPLEGGYDGELGDDQLRLIFTCCHPALAVEAQVALTSTISKRAERYPPITCCPPPVPICYAVSAAPPRPPRPTAGPSISPATPLSSASSPVG